MIDSGSRNYTPARINTFVASPIFCSRNRFPFRRRLAWPPPARRAPGVVRPVRALPTHATKGTNARTNEPTDGRRTRGRTERPTDSTDEGTDRPVAQTTERRHMQSVNRPDDRPSFRSSVGTYVRRSVSYVRTDRLRRRTAWTRPDGRNRAARTRQRTNQSILRYAWLCIHHLCM